MRCPILFIGIICIICVPSRSDAKNKCFNAKTCVHDAKEKCGEDGKEGLRRFLDTCDMKEFNCLRGTDYLKVPLESCQDLPPIDEKSSERLEEHIQEDQGVGTAEDEAKPRDEIKDNEE